MERGEKLPKLEKKIIKRKVTFVFSTANMGTLNPWIEATLADDGWRC